MNTPSVMLFLSLFFCALTSVANDTTSSHAPHMMAVTRVEQLPAKTPNVLGDFSQVFYAVGIKVEWRVENQSTILQFTDTNTDELYGSIQLSNPASGVGCEDGQLYIDVNGVTISERLWLSKLPIITN